MGALPPLGSFVVLSPDVAGEETFAPLEDSPTLGLYKGANSHGAASAATTAATVTTTVATAAVKVQAAVSTQAHWERCSPGSPFRKQVFQRFGVPVLPEQALLGGSFRRTPTLDCSLAG